MSGRLSRRNWLGTALLGALVAACLSASAAETSAPRAWLPASGEKLPRWRGFNLLEKFMLGSGRKPFVEEDFRLIAKLGFNFVRLPMDYRLWIVDGDWEKFDEATLKEIDQAVAWGEKYGIHVCINFHRAPGYTVARPAEKTSLWNDAETQRVCAQHWALFARRYRGIPSARVSFNLMNEPAHIDPEVYCRVARMLVAAIRQEDPQRLVISDGLQWGQLPIVELRELRIAQATRGYQPGELTHYKASWVRGENFPLPAWPKAVGPNGTLLSPSKKEGSHPLVIDGPFPAATQLRLHVMVVSSSARLVVEGDGAKLLEHCFQCGPGEGEWKRAEFKSQYKIYQNVYDRDYTATIPAGTRQVRIRVAQGDWLQLSQFGLKPAGAPREAVLTLKQQFGTRPDPLRYAPGAPNGPFVGLEMRDKAWLWKTCIEPWKEAESKGIGVMVGEWGCYNKTPHDVVLRWAEDCLSNWKQAGWGWALWNFRGSFGILDSERKDVRYEDFEGHQLDRQLLDLLLRY